MLTHNERRDILIGLSLSSTDQDKSIAVGRVMADLERQTDAERRLAFLLRVCEEFEFYGESAMRLSLIRRYLTEPIPDC